MPKVSVIVPVYKAEKYITKCITSVQDQTLDDWELIFVNDASPDHSIEIIKTMADRDTRIRYIDNRDNHGPMTVRYQGCQAATGEYLTFLDSDDWLPNDALEIMYNKAKEADYDIVCGDMQRINDKGVLGAKFNNKNESGNNNTDLFKTILNKEINQCLCSKLFKTSIWQSNGFVIFDHCTHAEDAGVLFQYIDHCESFAIIENVVYYYYTNLSSSSYNMTVHAIECICKNTVIRENVLRKYPELDEDYKRYFTSNLYNERLRKESYMVIKKYGLDNYASFKFILKYVPTMERLRFFAKWLLKPFKSVSN